MRVCCGKVGVRFFSSKNVGFFPCLPLPGEHIKELAEYARSESFNV